jgi:hypothetical protein
MQVLVLSDELYLLTTCNQPRNTVSKYKWSVNILTFVADFLRII